MLVTDPSEEKMLNVIDEINSNYNESKMQNKQAENKFKVLNVNKFKHGIPLNAKMMTPQPP